MKSTLGQRNGESTVRPVCRVEDIDHKYGKEIRVDTPGGERWLMLFTRQGSVIGFNNRCPHQARAMNFAPDRFMVSDSGQLVCPHHGACFDLDSGLCVSGPCKGDSLSAVDVRVSEGMVFVETGQVS